MVGGIGQAIGTALSGLSAQAKRVGVAASNIANAHSSGSLDEDAPLKAYKALEAILEGTEGGGVQANVYERDPATVIAYQPDAFYANDEGLVAAPNVNIDEEVITTLQASQAYKANAALVRVAREMQEELLSAVDTKA